MTNIMTNIYKMIWQLSNQKFFWFVCLLVNLFFFRYKLSRFSIDSNIQ